MQRSRSPGIINRNTHLSLRLFAANNDVGMKQEMGIERGGRNEECAELRHKTTILLHVYNWLQVPLGDTSDNIIEISYKTYQIKPFFLNIGSTTGSRPRNLRNASPGSTLFPVL